MLRISFGARIDYKV